MSVDVCYVLSHGFAARMVLHTEVLPALRAQGLTVALMVPNAQEDTMARWAAYDGVTVVQAPPVQKGLRSEYQRLRRYLFEDVMANPALRARHERLIADPKPGLAARIRPRLYRQVNRAALHLPPVRRLLTRLEQRALDHAPMDAALASLNPALVVATYPVAPLDATALHAARKAGRTTVGHLLSWDNITTKGRFPVVPDQFLTWGPIMDQELAEHYAISASHIHPCGVPHFDPHLGGATAAEVATMLQGLGLQPDQRYLFFGMSAPFFCPHEIDVVEWLAAAVEAGTFGADIQLIVRPHPQNVQGHLADARWLPRLDALRSPRVAIDYPELQESSLAWAMDPADLRHLVTLIAGAAVTLNSGSTLCIDALMQDRPVVMTAFDAGHTLPWWASARRVLAFPHLSKLIALGGVRVASDFDDLTAALQAYLHDPGRDAAARARSREAECGLCDGKAAERVAAALAAIRNAQDHLQHAPAGGVDG